MEKSSSLDASALTERVAGERERIGMRASEAFKRSPVHGYHSRVVDRARPAGVRIERTDGRRLSATAARPRLAPGNS